MCLTPWPICDNVLIISVVFSLNKVLYLYTGKQSRFICIVRSPVLTARSPGIPRRESEAVRKGDE